MLSESLKEKYYEAFDAFSEAFNGKKSITVRHKSEVKIKNNTNQDICFVINGVIAFGVYVGKKCYKIYINNGKWVNNTSFADERDKNGWWRIRRTSLDDTIEEIKNGLSIGWNISID